MSALILKNISKIFPGGTQALRDFNLRVEEGELVAIVGPSGCGKSTLLRIVAGLDEASSGTVHLGDRTLDGLHPKSRDVGMVFQSYTLLPHLTVGENMAFGLKMRGISKKERTLKAVETARLLGIANLLERLPSEISGGERQRAALGRAILRQPGIYLFDEPLSSLDAQMRLQVRVEIQKLHQRSPVPMLYVTHDQSEALTLGDRVMVLHQGRIQQVAPPEEIIRRPANTFTASFIGSPGMNLVRGRIETVENSVRFVSPCLNFNLLPDQAAVLRGCHEVLAGVRPEHLSPDVNGAFRGEVTVVERQPPGCCLYLKNGDILFAVRTHEALSVRTGETMAFGFDRTKMLFYGTDSGELIGSPA